MGYRKILCQTLLMIELRRFKRENISSFCTALQKHYRSSHNLAKGSWIFWHIIDVWKVCGCFQVQKQLYICKCLSSPTSSSFIFVTAFKLVFYPKGLALQELYLNCICNAVLLLWGIQGEKRNCSSLFYRDLFIYLSHTIILWVKYLPWLYT